jgi:hypothetical protein
MSKYLEINLFDFSMVSFILNSMGYTFVCDQQATNVKLFNEIISS